jgi:hypothetical protein
VQYECWVVDDCSPCRNSKYVSIWLNDRELLLWRRAVLYLRHYSKRLHRLLIGSPETVLVHYTSAMVVDDCSPLQQVEVRDQYG